MTKKKVVGKPKKSTARARKPGPLTLVRFDFDAIDPSYHSKYPFVRDRVYVYVGDIRNMEGHCVVIDHKTGQIYSGYHFENFRELDEDEV